MSDVYFLKTGNWFISYRGYFDEKEDLKEKVHSIIEKSLKLLVKSWEKAKKKKWERPVHKIISRDDMMRSVQIFTIPDDEVGVKLFPVCKLSKKMRCL